MYVVFTFYMVSILAGYSYFCILISIILWSELLKQRAFGATVYRSIYANTAFCELTRLNSVGQIKIYMHIAYSNESYQEVWNELKLRFLKTKQIALITYLKANEQILTYIYSLEYQIRWRISTQYDCILLPMWHTLYNLRMKSILLIGQWPLKISLL